MESIRNQNEKRNIDERAMPESEQKIIRAFIQGVEFAHRTTEKH